MRTCKEISKLISESLDHKLSLWQRISLWTHLGMCKICRRFRKDLHHIDSNIQQHASDLEQDGDDSDVKLSENSRERMKKFLESQSKD